MMPQPRLTLSFDPGNGDPPLRMTVPFSEREGIRQPSRSVVAFLAQSFEEVVEVLRTKQFRKDVFVREATRLGHLLAERMEDAEGWHDESRIEPAKAQLLRGDKQ